jgi:hypothetical protein
VTRRCLLGSAAGLLAPAATPFYSVQQRAGRWWLLTPEAKLQFSLGLNHIDPATLRYPENAHIWRDKYGNSMRRWLRESVRPNLLRWGFNCVGWAQEVVTRGLTNHRHSRPWTRDEYDWLDLPYCHLLPFAEFHQWEAETRHPDLFSPDFAAWCDHVAREHCVPLADDRKLIGYFYVDCPTWVHTRQWNTWKGPLFDPERLGSAAGRAELSRLATQYYRTTFEAIRRYDRNHLILGDRYEAAAALPPEVVHAASPYVDVLSFQHFSSPQAIRDNLVKWHAETGKPVLVADSARSLPGPGGGLRNDPAHYSGALAALRTVPSAVGFHLCGAYLTNRVRRRGLLDEREAPDREFTDTVARENRAIEEWATAAGGSVRR